MNVDVDPLALGGALLQAVILAWQIRYLRGTIDQMKASERRGLRAYVTVDSARLDWTAEGPSFVLDLVNTGQTPVTRFEISMVAELVTPGTDPESLLVPEHIVSKVWAGLPNGGHRTVRFEPENCPLRIGDLPSNNSRYLSARGRVRYADVFGETWESEFSFFKYGDPGPVKADDRRRMAQPHSRLRLYQKVA